MPNISDIRWLRVLLCGVLVESFTIALIIVSVSIFKLTASPDGGALTSFENFAGYVIGIFGSALFALALGWWAAKGAKSYFLIHGLLVGLIAAALHVTLYLASPDGFQPIYALADALKIGSAALGGGLYGRTVSRSREIDA
jgi:hypothetical protein